METINFAKVKQVFLPEGEVQSIHSDGVVLWQYGDPDQPYLSKFPLAGSMNAMKMEAFKDGESDTTVFMRAYSGNTIVHGWVNYNYSYLLKYNKTTDTLSVWRDPGSQYDVDGIGVPRYIYDNYNSILYRYLYPKTDNLWQESSDGGWTFTTIDTPAYNVLACLNDIMFGVPYEGTEKEKNTIYYLKNSTWNKLLVDFDSINKYSFYYINNNYIIVGLKLNADATTYSPIIRWSSDLINWNETQITNTSGDAYTTTKIPSLVFLGNKFYISFYGSVGSASSSYVLSYGESLNNLTTKSGANNEIPNGEFIGIVNNYYAFYKLVHITTEPKETYENIVMSKNLSMDSDDIITFKTIMLDNLYNDIYDSSTGGRTILCSNIFIPINTEKIVILSIRGRYSSSGYPQRDSVKIFKGTIEQV